MSQPNPAAPPTFCSSACRAVEEPLQATATRADTWLLLEYTGRWGTKAFPESALPQPVKDHLSAYEQARPHTHIQFIKRAPPYTADLIQFFVAVAQGAEPRLYRFDLRRYEDLFDLDLEGIIAGDATYDGARVASPLYLVCTNGLRDACCAKYGLEVFTALEAVAGSAVWQTTHLGGHRFAPILLVLPYSLHYGQVEVADVQPLVEATQRGDIYPPRFRGRTLYDRPVQAADIFLRQQTGEWAVGAYEPVEAQRRADDTWDVLLQGRDGGGAYTVRVAERVFPHPVQKSCRDEQASTVTHFSLVEHAAR